MSMRLIKNYPDYSINTNGDVWSKTRRYSDGRLYSGRFLMPNLTANTGYHSVVLYKNSKHKRVSVHRLVAETFIRNPKHLPCINHKDGNKLNNHISNLEWCSYSQNHLHSFRKLGRKVWNKGIKKERPILNCLWCGCPFRQKRCKQVLCGRKCTGQRNGNARKTKPIHLIEQGIVTP